MKFFLFLSYIFFLTPASSSENCQHKKDEFQCVEYVKNYDADTITFNIKNVHPLIGENISVRVFGIDAPEIKGNHPCEKEASRNAKKLVENLMKNARRIDLKNVEKDKYFRILANVYFDGKNLKEILIKNNLAYEYDGGTKKDVNWCQRGIASKK